MISNQRILNFLVHGKLMALVLPVLCLLTVEISLYMTFVYAPNEQVMGAVQRIFYFHVGSAMASYIMLGLMFVGSVVYLNSKKPIWDYLANSAVSVAFLFSSIVLATGMIWGHSAWNTWWRWEPRLVSSLVLWLMLFGYILLRRFSEGLPTEKGVAAVLGILTALQVPIVIFSVRMLDHTEQLHPQIAANQGLRDPRYVQTLLFTISSLSLLSLWLFKIRLTQLLQEEQVEDLEIQALDASN